MPNLPRSISAKLASCDEHVTDTAIEAVLRHDRAIVAGSLFLLAGLAWAYMLWLAADMDMGGMDMSGFRMIPRRHGSDGADDRPLERDRIRIRLCNVGGNDGRHDDAIGNARDPIYARVGRQAAQRESRSLASSWFAGGYLLAWVGFALVATFAQWALERGSWLTPEMAAASEILSGIVLIVAGLYQWTPLKDACLRQCRAPLQFIQRHGGFRPEALGSLALGARHGGYCIGCCSVLMAILFVGGVMNVLWIAAVTILVLLEKTVPGGRVTSRVSGAGLFAGGVWMLAHTL